MSRMMRISEVASLVALSRSTIYARMAAGTFPRSRDYGGGVVRWRESDIHAWLAERPETAQTEVQR